MSGTLTIDLSAIQANWLQVGNGLSAATENAAVIKANAYGLGVEAVARALSAVGCRTFFVATLVEAEQVKKIVDGDVRIFILTGVDAGAELACIEGGFIPVLASPQQIKRWAKACQRIGAQGFSAIKVDTGMHRLGLDQREFAELCADLGLLLACSPVLLMSHLACANSASHPLNREQRTNFQQCAELMRALVPTISLSLANSSGICLGADYHYDLVRPGACLYGVNPTPQVDNPMATVVTLRLPILQIKTLSGPASVGYDACYSIADGESKTLAIVAGGYGDGLFNHLSNRGYAYLAGHRVPLVGRVSMDTCIFDISAVGETQGHSFDQLSPDQLSPDQIGIEVLNDVHGVDELAREAGTIGYEVLASLGHRYRRIYQHGIYQDNDSIT